MIAKRLYINGMETNIIILKSGIYLMSEAFTNADTASTTNRGTS